MNTNIKRNDQGLFSTIFMQEFTVLNKFDRFKLILLIYILYFYRISTFKLLT